jgi:hypothetical protein
MTKDIVGSYRAYGINRRSGIGLGAARRFFGSSDLTSYLPADHPTSSAPESALKKEASSMTSVFTLERRSPPACSQALNLKLAQACWRCLDEMMSAGAAFCPVRDCWEQELLAADDRLAIVHDQPAAAPFAVGG